MAFYDRFELLCKEKGITPTQAGRDNGIAQGVVSMWKKRGSVPKAETVQKLAKYFGASADFLLGKCSEGYPVRTGDSLYDNSVSVHEVTEMPDGKFSATLIFDPEKLSIDGLNSILRACNETGVSADAVLKVIELFANTEIPDNLISELANVIQLIDLNNRYSSETTTQSPQEPAETPSVSPGDTNTPMEQDAPEGAEEGE